MPFKFYLAKTVSFIDLLKQQTKTVKWGSAFKRDVSYARSEVLISEMPSFWGVSLAVNKVAF
jgi:hypothetical protein